MKTGLLLSALILIIFVSGCQSVPMTGTEIATFNGRETAIVPSR